MQDSAHDATLLPPQMWPPNSPDLSTLDYGLWEILEGMVWSHGVRAITLEGLKARIVKCWDELLQYTIYHTMYAFPYRL